MFWRGRDVGHGVEDRAAVQLSEFGLSKRERHKTGTKAEDFRGDFVGCGRFGVAGV